jgi:hypothetical protein
VKHREEETDRMTRIVALAVQVFGDRGKALSWLQSKDDRISCSRKTIASVAVERRSHQWSYSHEHASHRIRWPSSREHALADRRRYLCLTLLWTYSGEKSDGRRHTAGATSICPNVRSRGSACEPKHSRHAMGIGSTGVSKLDGWKLALLTSAPKEFFPLGALRSLALSG